MADSDVRLTRRGLFRGIGTAAVVAGCKPDADTEAPIAKSTTDAPGKTVSAQASPLEFTLNGEKVQLEVEARTTLAEALRLDLDRTGTKISCDRGSCGACMVLVDGTVTLLPLDPVPFPRFIGAIQETDSAKRRQGRRQ